MSEETTRWRCNKCEPTKPCYAEVDFGCPRACLLSRTADPEWDEVPVLDAKQADLVLGHNGDIYRPNTDLQPERPLIVNINITKQN